MSKNKPPQVTKKNEVSIVRSSAAEYLTFVAASGQGGVEAVYADENVWVTQKMMGLLYDVETHTCPRRSKFEPGCRLKCEPGQNAEQVVFGCG